MSEITTKIEEKRTEIDALNTEIVQRIAKRTAIAKQIGKLKKQEQIEIRDPEREHLMLTQVRNDATLYGVDPEYIEDVFRAIIKGARDVQK